MKNRSSHRRCSKKKFVFRNFPKFTGICLCQSLFFKKRDSRLRPATLLKKSLWHRCFPVNFAKFLRITFLQNTYGRLLQKKPEKSRNNIVSVAIPSVVTGASNLFGQIKVLHQDKYIKQVRVIAFEVFKAKLFSLEEF